MVKNEEILKILKKEPVSEKLEKEKKEVKKYLEEVVYPSGTVYAIKDNPSFTSYMVKFDQRNEDMTIRMASGSARELAKKRLIVHFDIRHSFPMISSVGNTIRVDIPKKPEDKGVLRLGSLLEYVSKAKDKGVVLPVPFGLGADGKVKIKDMNKTETRSLLIAGQNGSGKTVFGRNLLVNLLLSNNSKNVKVMLFDPKGTEFPKFRGIKGVVKISDDIEAMYKDADDIISEMNERNNIFKISRCGNFEEYNKKNPDKKMPFYFIFVDEYQNILSAKTGKLFDESMGEIARKGRSAGIHLIVMTQRPTAKELGNIRSELTGRICFKVDTANTAKMALGKSDSGAEYLLGNGDGIMMEGNTKMRFQAPFIDFEELDVLCDYLRKSRE